MILRGLALLFGLLVTAHFAAGDETPRGQAVGRKAFEQRPAFPWYDAEHDELRPIELPELRESTPRKSFDFPVTPLAWAAWSALFVLLAASAALIYLAWRSMPDSGPSLPSKSPGRTVDQTGDLEALPVRDLRDGPSLRAAADEAYRAGRYREAMIYLFSYQLLLLDQGHFIRLARGKTNRQYLRELTSHDRLRGLMSGSVATFEDAFFGGRSLERGEFEACWRRLGEFQGLTTATP